MDQIEVRLIVLSKNHSLLGLSYQRGYETRQSTGEKRDFHEFSIGFFFFTISVVII